MAEPVAMPVTEANVEQQSVVVESDYRKIIKSLVAEGAKKIVGVKVKNVNFKEEENYTWVSLTLTSKVPAYVLNPETQAYELGESNVIFVSLFSLVGALRENEEYAWMGSHIATHPTCLTPILCGATISLLQRYKNIGDTLNNPFSTKDTVNGKLAEHDTILTDIIDFSLGTTGKNSASILLGKLMGF